MRGLGASGFFVPPPVYHSVRSSDGEHRMRNVRRSVWGAMALAILALAAARLDAAPPMAKPPVAKPPAAKPAEPLAVDVLELKPFGPSIRGAFLQRSDDGKTVSMAAQRWWLEKHAPELYNRHRSKEKDSRRDALKELTERIARWEKDRPDDRKLRQFLGDERDRATKLLEGPADALDSESRFTVLEVPAADIRRLTLASPESRQVALVAWAEELQNVETRTAADLRNELKKDGLDVVGRIVNAVEWLPPRRDTAAQWAARRAIVEYEYRRASDYQGAGGAYFRTGEGARAPDLGEVLTAMFQSQLAGNLLDLLGGDGPKKPAASSELPAPLKTAERDDVAGVRITSMDQDLAARRVTVRETFWARVPKGNDPNDLRWEPVFEWNETADGSKPRPDAEGRIEKDPQVRKALDLVSKLLPGGDGDQAIRTAIRFGAAVMEAQQAADSRFYRFRDTYLKSLEGPPLAWARPAN